MTLPFANLTLDAAGVGFSLSAALLIVSWARAYAKCAQLAEAQLQKHYAATQRLLKDAAVSESLVDFLQTFAGMAGRPSTARNFLIWRFVFKRFERHSEDAAFDAAVDELNGPQRQAFASVIFSGLMASALASPFFGVFYAEMMLSTFEAKKDSARTPIPPESPKKATELAVAIRNDRPFAHAFANAA